MNEVIGDVLPLALGVAISPIPIIAAILMLLSPRARATSVGFLAGWVLGVAGALTVFVLLGSLLPPGDDAGSTPIVGTIRIIIGALFLVLAVGQWRKRPKPGADPVLPKWMSAVESMRPIASFGLGFALAALNPKNLLMAAAAGVAVGSSGLTVGEQLVPGAIFVVLAISTVAVPVIAYLVASERMARPLEGLRSWLVANSATVMTVLLLVIGVVNIGKGVASF
jgi:hypothetical protein